MVMARSDYLDHLAADIDRMADVLDAGPLDAPVSWCGDWTVADLGVHLGSVHRWATFAVRHARPPGADDISDPAPEGADGAQLAAWLRAGGDLLIAALAAMDLDAPTWHPFPVAKVGAVWPRRQAQEAAVHRWDAERAVGRTPSIDPALAADGIDEYFGLALPRLMHRERVGAPPASLLVRALDTGDEWHVAAGDGTVLPVEDPARVPGTTVSGAAEQVLLALWRRPIPPGAVTVEGDDPGWLSLGGM
jgi:uncharacterized protein (TIGR03083 family)